jgi:hypothetical protein
MTTVPPPLLPDNPGDFAIGLRPIAPHAWIQGGEPQPWLRKDRLYADHRRLVFGELEGSRAGQAEVLELVDTVTVDRPTDLDGPPLFAASRRIADDLCLMQREAEDWRLTAISLSAGTYFTADEALGKTLAELHGPVPGFGERLLTRVRRIFDNLPADSVLERRNWTVTNSEALFAPDPAPIRARIAGIDAATAGAVLRVRSERQTIRRLPRTGGIVFMIRIWSRSLDELAAGPGGLAPFAVAWRAASVDFAAYKRFDLYAPLVESVLRARGE